MRAPGAHDRRKVRHPAVARPRISLPATRRISSRTSAHPLQQAARRTGSTVDIISERETIADVIGRMHVPERLNR